MKVGFIGLGIMGKPMALHVIKSGYETYIFDLNTNAVDELKILGGNACSSNSEIAERLLHTHYTDRSYLLGGDNND